METKGELELLPKGLVKERNRYIVDLKQSGLSIESIVKYVNIKNRAKNWGVVDRDIVLKAISKHYKNNTVLNPEDYQEMRYLREAHVSQMEGLIEKMALHISKDKEKDPVTGEVKPKKWRPFEYADAVSRAFTMMKELSEIQNWSLGRHNDKAFIVQQQQNIYNFEQAGQELKTIDETVLNSFVSKLENMKKELENKEKERNIIEGESEDEVVIMDDL